MRYVVTGSAGFIGGHLVTALERQGHYVVGVDLEHDLATVGMDFAGLDGVFHLAGQPGVRTSWEDFGTYLERNLLATQRVFEAAVEAQVRVVYASSSSVYGDAETYPTPETVTPHPLSPYGVTKLACEHLAYAYALQGLDAVGLRYFTVYGPRQRPDMAFSRIFDALANDTKFTLYGNAARSFTYVADAVDATILAMDRGRAPIYNIGGDASVSMDFAIRMAEHVTGRDLRVERLPAARGDATWTSADAALAADDLGWYPTTLIEDGMAAQWSHVLQAVPA